MRALVVEDSLPIRAAVRDGLAEQGFAVDVAANGEDGLWLAEQNPYDIVVLDIMLPLIDGLEVLRRLRAKGSKVAVLLLTARDTVEDRVTGLDSGADDYLFQPVRQSTLRGLQQSVPRFQGLRSLLENDPPCAKIQQERALGFGWARLDGGDGDRRGRGLGRRSRFYRRRRGGRGAMGGGQGRRHHDLSCPGQCRSQVPRDVQQLRTAE